MLPHRFRVSWRHIRNHPLSSVIHVVGLSIGICTCIVIYLVVRYDWSFDRFHPHSERIYRIIGEQTMSNGQVMFMNSPSSDAAPLEHSLPGVGSEVIYHFLMERITIPASAGRSAMS